ncbi:MAG: hypothetical protein OXK78_08965, partial [Caldilineaceae bacterium]|nr:hypothetical protein [Caldilineaceae bacterium]
RLTKPGVWMWAQPTSAMFAMKRFSSGVWLPLPPGMRTVAGQRDLGAFRARLSSVADRWATRYCGAVFAH